MDDVVQDVTSEPEDELVSSPSAGTGDEWVDWSYLTSLEGEASDGGDQGDGVAADPADDAVIYYLAGDDSPGDPVPDEGGDEGVVTPDDDSSGGVPDGSVIYYLSGGGEGDEPKDDEPTDDQPTDDGVTDDGGAGDPGDDVGRPTDDTPGGTETGTDGGIIYTLEDGDGGTGRDFGRPDLDLAPHRMQIPEQLSGSLTTEEAADLLDALHGARAALTQHAGGSLPAPEQWDPPAMDVSAAFDTESAPVAAAHFAPGLAADLTPAIFPG
ncbi:MAG TPA: hypothetical protein VF727_11935 [Allosphingosinicella sp.]